MRVNNHGRITTLNKKEKALVYQCVLHYIYANNGVCLTVNVLKNNFKVNLGLCIIMEKALRHLYPDHWIHFTEIPKLLPEFFAFKPKNKQVDWYWWPISPNGEKTRIRVVKRLVELTSK